MFQLRAFVNERLCAAATEILGEVEKTMAMYEYEVTRTRDEVDDLRKQLEHLRETSAAEPTQPSSTVVREEHYPTRLQDPGPSTPAEMEEDSNLSLRHDLPGPSQTSADVENNDWNYSMLMTDLQIPHIKGEQEELCIDSQKQEAVIPSPDIVKSEQDLRRETPGPYQTSADIENNNQTDLKISQIQSEQEELGSDSQKHDGIYFPNIVKSERDQTDFTHELQPLASDDEDCVESKETQTRSKKCNVTGASNRTTHEGLTALPYEDSSTNSQTEHRFCHLCGKAFQSIGSLMKHIDMHEKIVDCGVCGETCQSTEELISHLQCVHSHANFCDVCGKTFSKTHVLRRHAMIHTGQKQYKCYECGKAFLQKAHLIVHVRTHSGEKPYYCDICCKAFSQSQNLTIHKRSHTGEKPYQCGSCDKFFKTSSHLKIHMRYHSGEKPYCCDVCGKHFSQSGQLTTHKRTHTGERPFGCHLCGMRYRFAPNLKAHLKTHETETT